MAYLEHFEQQGGIENNNRIFQAITAVLGSSGAIEEVSLKKDVPLYQIVQLGTAINEQHLNRLFEELVLIKLPVPDLTYPVNFLNEFGNAMERRITSPYGVLPNVVIGKDDFLYELSNVYFFDANGKVFKAEGIYKFKGHSSLEEAVAQIVDATPDYVTRVNFIPREDDSRFTDLETGDYEKILGLLGQITRGEFEEVRKDYVLIR